MGAALHPRDGADTASAAVERLSGFEPTPERLARWIAEVSGDLRVGGTVHAVFTSTWSGPARIEACEAPHHLLLTTQPGTDDEAQIEAWLTADGARTRLVVEERGLPIGELHYHGAGWQAHLEDLGTSLASAGSSDRRRPDRRPPTAHNARECIARSLAKASAYHGQHPGPVASDRRTW